MTTAVFIAKTYNTKATRELKCSSVFTDNNGVVYSYGYHYPLAFNIAGLDFINTAGYSKSTARHISWAWRALGYDAIGVELGRDDAYKLRSSNEDDKLDVVLDALNRQADRLRAAMRTKKRKDTKLYADLQAQLDKVVRNTHAVMEAM